ncbi:hypothetical protein VdG2_06687 [Verticillium dahliae VDG2]|nr:hypothetical protein VdG2_06687 [Verticillium dahliae VDG2]
MAPALHTLAAAILRRADEPSDEKKTDPHKGTTDAHDINNTAVFVVFGLIGAAFVCTGIWFFFWAKNGGFYFKENDWDDYKTTVLRRRGPNGTLLTGATPSTNLGGGSKAGGIRKVYSTADRTADREQERIRAEARRLAERGRAAGSARRDFSYQRADSNVSESDVGLQRGSRVGLIREESESDVGTRSYRNGIPVPNSPSAVGSDYAEEKRRNRRAGYRRER